MCVETRIPQTGIRLLVVRRLLWLKDLDRIHLARPAQSGSTPSVLQARHGDGR